MFNGGVTGCPPQVWTTSPPFRGVRVRNCKTLLSKDLPWRFRGPKAHNSRADWGTVVPIPEVLGLGRILLSWMEMYTPHCTNTKSFGKHTNARASWLILMASHRTVRRRTFNRTPLTSISFSARGAYQQRIAFFAEEGSGNKSHPTPGQRLPSSLDPTGTKSQAPKFAHFKTFWAI